jgi:hypothetical protein
MARMDKTDSTVGVVRGTLAANFAAGDFNKVVGVGINASGRTVKGAGQTGVIGIMIPNPLSETAGRRCDIFKLGDAVDCDGLKAGTKYYSTPAGDLVEAAEGNTYVGYTVEADRLVLAGF